MPSHTGTDGEPIRWLPPIRWKEVIEDFSGAVIKVAPDWGPTDDDARRINVLRAQLLKDQLKANAIWDGDVRIITPEGPKRLPRQTSGEKTMFPNTTAEKYLFGFWVVDPSTCEFLRDLGNGTTSDIGRAHIYDPDTLKEFASTGESYAEYLKKCILIPALPLRGYPDGSFKEMFDVLEYVGERLGSVLQEEAKAKARAESTRRHVKA